MEGALTSMHLIEFDFIGGALDFQLHPMLHLIFNCALLNFLNMPLEILILILYTAIN